MPLTSESAADRYFKRAQVQKACARFIGEVNRQDSTRGGIFFAEIESFAERVIIQNNLIDVRDSDIPTTGNGILVQASTGGQYLGPVLIQNNTIVGDYNVPRVKITNQLSNGIYVFGDVRNVTIRNNSVTRTGQSGIRIEGDRIIVEGNKLVDAGGGGTPGVIVNAKNSRFVNNTYIYTGDGPADNRIDISAESRNNVFERNTGFEMPPNFR